MRMHRTTKSTRVCSFTGDTAMNKCKEIIIIFVVLFSCIFTACGGEESIENGNNFSGMILKGEDFSGRTIENVDFSGADLSGTTFSGAVLRNVKFTGSIMNGTDFTSAIIEDCTFDQSTMRGGLMVSMFVRDSTLNEANWQGNVLVMATFQNVTSEGATFRLADWTDVQILSSTFSNTIWEYCICPEGGFSEDREGTCL